MTDLNQQEYLSDWALNIVLYIERVHSMTGLIPSDTAIMEYTKKAPGEINALKTNSLFKSSLDSRGIVVNYELHKEFRDVTELTPRQMAAASLMMNLTDRRSNEKKLRDLGISTEEYANWLQDTKFAEYLRERAEVMITNSTHEAHIGLMRGVQQGNTASIKLYYELTGRYNPNQENQVNVRLVIGQVLEAIQKHIRDPEILNSLAVEMSQIAIEAGSPVARTTVVPGMSTRKELS